jgi:glycine/D-amino acid oxidase-like deaminating enzyme
LTSVAPPIEGDAVVIAMGPWSMLAASWVHLPQLYDTGTDVPADAPFLEYHEESGAVVTVGVFPRADGSTLVTAFFDQSPLPLDPATVTPEPSEIDRRSPSGCHLNYGRRQACFRLVTYDGLPLQSAAERGRLRRHRP